MEKLWSIGMTLAFLAGFGALALRWLAFCGVSLPGRLSAPLPERQGAAIANRELMTVFGSVLSYRVLILMTALLLFNILSDYPTSLSELPELWSRWDAPHYIKLAELGYGGYLEDGQPLFLVFYPLYVWLMRGLSLLIPNTGAAGMLISNLCCCWAFTCIYRLVSEDYGRKTAAVTLVLLAAYPFSFYFGGIMTESLFLLTTSKGLYHIRHHHWGRAGIWGILAALTRMQGVILVGAAIAELCNEVKPFAYRGAERKTAFGTVFKKLPLLCVPVLGSLLYFLLNYSVTGDPFAFTKMQQHWSQGFMWFPQVLSYLIKNAFTWPDLMTRLDMWIPELVLFPLCVILLMRSWKKHRSMYTLYGTVYFILNYCLSWLLSAGRYLSCNVPCFIFAADCMKDKPKRLIALSVVLWLLQLFYTCRYFCWGQVM